MRHNCAFLPQLETIIQKLEDKSYIVLLGSLLLCHVFPQGIKDLNLELYAHYRSYILSFKQKRSY